MTDDFGKRKALISYLIHRMRNKNYVRIHSQVKERDYENTHWLPNPKYRRT